MRICGARPDAYPNASGCHLDRGHEGPHEATMSGGSYGSTVTWYDHPTLKDPKP